jgi:hypothetical protein
MKTLFNLPTALLLVVIVFISGCKEGEDAGACGSGTDYFEIGANDVCCPSPVFTPYSGGQALDPEALYYYTYNNGTVDRAVYFFGITVDQICTEEHLQLKFNYTLELTSGGQLPVPLKIYGEAYWSIYQDEVILVVNEQTPGHGINSVPLEVGLKQAFGDGAATVDVYINVEFDSFGDESTDESYFIDHVMELKAYAEYSKF